MPKNKRKKPQKKYSRFLIVILGIFVFCLVGAFFLTGLQKSCADSISCIKDLSGAYIEGANYGQFEGKAVPVPAKSQEQFATAVVLGDQTTSNKRIEIDLTTQHMYTYEGNTRIHDFLISSGQYQKTPVGDFKFWIKLRYHHFSGGSRENHTFYDLPNTPYTMFFYNDQIPKWRGYAIHGAYWHNNFGHPMSHGCINMKIADAETLYYWAEPPPTGSVTKVEDNGTPIKIYGTASNT